MTNNPEPVATSDKLAKRMGAEFVPFDASGPEIKPLSEPVAQSGCTDPWCMDDHDFMAEIDAMPKNPAPTKHSPSEGWQTIRVERALYVDQGREVILCDRLPSPVTLLVRHMEIVPLTEPVAHADLVEKLQKRAQKIRGYIASSQLVVDLLAPEMAKFEARTGHDLYTVRMAVDHVYSIRTQTKEAEEYEEAAAELTRLRAEVKHLTPYVEAFRREETRADQKSQIVDDLRAELARKDEALRECVETFDFYEQSHLAKGTQDGDEKAYRNKQMANKCRAALKEPNQ